MTSSEWTSHDQADWEWRQNLRRLIHLISSAIADDDRQRAGQEP